MRPSQAGQRWLASALLAVLAVLGCAPAMAAPDPAATTAAAAHALQDVPRGKGLPVVVRAALSFASVDAFDDSKGSFEATTDLRTRWNDSRLQFPAASAARGYREFRGAAAEAELARIWTPPLRMANRIGEPTLSERRLRIFPDGKVEVLARTSAAYKAEVDVTQFPFDRQALRIDIVVRGETLDAVDLDFTSDDVDFSKVDDKATLGGWTLGLVNLDRAAISGWDGENYASLSASLGVRRLAAGAIATVFIPLFASLLIPFLATWMNRANGGSFEVDAFELANVVIGGLFAVIALSFAISAAYPVVAAGDNTVTRLIGLNYVALAVGLFIIVVFYRYALPARWFGPYLQEQAFRFMIWAFPFLFICTGLAFLLMAAA